MSAFFEGLDHAGQHAYCTVSEIGEVVCWVPFALPVTVTM
jgi:hypothetical protein